MASFSSYIRERVGTICVIVSSTLYDVEGERHKGHVVFIDSQPLKHERQNLWLHGNSVATYFGVYTEA